VLLVRSPLEAIPSRLGLIRAIWRRRFPGFGDLSPGQVETILEDSLRTYRAAERDLPAVPGTHRLVVRYEALVADPAGVVREIYARFGLPGPDAVLGQVLTEVASRPRPARRPAATLAEFGLDEARLRRELPDGFARYGW
jgi:hypothetical protein